MAPRTGFQGPPRTAGRVHPHARCGLQLQREHVLQRVRPGREDRRLVPARQPAERGPGRDDGLPLPARRAGRPSCSGGPKIADNKAMNAGGLKIEVVEPFKKLKLTYDGKALPAGAAVRDGRARRTAFRNNPQVAVQGRARLRGRVSRCSAARRCATTASRCEIDPEKSFAKAHYEQHMHAKGTFTVGDETFQVDGYRPARQVVGTALLVGDQLVPLVPDELRPRLRR